MYHHESGASKRKKKKEREDDLKRQQGSLKTFLSKYQSSDKSTNEKASSDIEPDMLSQVQQQVNETNDKINQKDSVVPEDNVETESRSIDPCTESKSSTSTRAKNDPEPCPGDPALWPATITEEIREQFIFKKPDQVYGDISVSRLKDGPKKHRKFQMSNFYRKMSNGEMVKRDWLVYSGTTGRVYCYVCKLFSTSVSKTVFTSDGLQDWKNIQKRLSEHENSKDHRTCMCCLLSRSKIAGRVDTHLEMQYEVERRYWREVLRRIVSTVKLLSTRGLSFRGDNEKLFFPNNGNYLGCLEFLSEFDPFLAEHLAKFGNSGKGIPSYLSSTICDEFIKIMSEKVKKVMVEELKAAKYYSLIVDSTPDISHTDQLTFIVRYISPDGQPVERFLGFIPISSHTGSYLENTVLDTLKNIDIDIKYCRGQSYDNASNMSGKYSGLQARIKQHSEEADYIPCANHSLNLVGNCAAESCTMAVAYFNFVQNLYAFLSASTHRWETLTNCYAKKGKKLTVKCLSSTRWSARADATEALRIGYIEIKEALIKLSNDESQKSTARLEAKHLAKKISHWENALMTVIWDTLLQRFNSTSKSLQHSHINLGIAADLYKSLYRFVQLTRDNFKNIEEEAMHLTTERDFRTDVCRKQVRKRFFDEIGVDYTVNYSGRNTFIVENFYLICDTLILELKRRMETYSNLNNRFRVFYEHESMNINDKRNAAVQLKSVYKYDLDDGFEDELVQFLSLASEKQISGPCEMYKLIQTYNLVSTFPNVEIALRIYLSLPSTNASAERSFSVLKRVKNYLRSTMTQHRLSALALLAIESNLTKTMDFNDVIDEFAVAKSRKKLM